MPPGLQAPTIDDRTFDNIVAEARTRIPRYTAEWTDFNEGDPGMALVEVMAWMTELLIYRMNRVPDLAYIKFLELIGITLTPAAPATALITVAVQNNWPANTVSLPLRSQFAAPAADGQGTVIFETSRSLIVFAPVMDSVQTFVGGVYVDQTAPNLAADTPWAPFTRNGDPGTCLVLGFTYDGAFPARTEFVLTFWTTEGGNLGAVTCGVAPVTPGTVLVWEAFDGTNWHSVTLLKDETLALTRSGQMFIKTPDPGVMKSSLLGPITDKPRYWLRLRVATKDWDVVPQLLAVRINTVTADQGETIEGEILGGSDGTAGQPFTLSGSPVLDGTLVLQVDEGAGLTTWTEVDDFSGSGPNDPVYVLDRGAGVVTFGGPDHGRIPVANPALPNSSILASTYRFGGGTRGNVAAATLATLLTPVDGLDLGRVGNLFAADGGSDEETLSDAKARAGQALQSRGRAVTTADFETIAKAAGPVGRAKALPLVHPSFPGIQVPGVVSVVIVPAVGGLAPLPSDTLLRQVCACLDAARLLTTEVYVIPPAYLSVTVTTELVTTPDVDAGVLQGQAVAALNTLFHPLTGGSDGKGWPFGGTIYFSVVLRALMALQVTRVGSMTIELDGVVYPPCTDVPVPALKLLASADHVVTVLTESAL
ncbi:MAG: putative baseplate assembly protein [Rhodopila sp.]